MNQNLTHLFAEKRRKRFQILTLGFSDFQVRFFDFQVRAFDFQVRVSEI